MESAKLLQRNGTAMSARRISKALNSMAPMGGDTDCLSWHQASESIIHCMASIPGGLVCAASCLIEYGR